MRKIFLFAAVASFVSFIPSGIVAQTNVPVYIAKGMASTNSENVNKETDPQFTAFVVPASTGKAMNNSNRKNLSQLEQGMDIVEEIVDRLIEREYSFSLLSGQKYMVNNCLGIKASSGQFDLKFANPSITLANGKFKVKLKIDKIKFSALKVRSRPRVPDFSDPDPCHFSGKFEIGGEATDVSVSFTMDLVAIAASSAAGYCALAFGQPVEIRWDIGGFNLRPMPNAIDNMAKNMVEDALNNGMTDLVYTRLLAVAKAVLPEYFDACENVENLVKKTDDISNPISSENDKSSLKPVSGLAKNMGRLNLVFPKDVEWDVDVYTTANKFIINRSSANKHTSYPLAAGKYNIKLSTVRVDNLEIVQGKETRIKSGILNVTIAGPWELRTREDKFLTSGNKPKKLALPVGFYLLKEGKNSSTVEIKDQQENQVVAEEEVPVEKWTVTPGVTDGIMGAFAFDFPPEVEWTVAIYKLPQREYVRIVGDGEKLESVPLEAGKFEFVLNNVPVKDVPIESGSRTILKYGVLHVNGNSSWSIWDATGTTHFKTENRGSKLVFPVGNYVIKMEGAAVKVELKDGETVTL